MVYPQKKVSTKAVLSMVFGILSLTCTCLLLGLPALILGLLAKRDIRRSGGQLSGTGFATAGIVLGIVSVIIIPIIYAAIAIPNFLEAQGRSKVSRTMSELRSMALGIESYYIDHGEYPAWAKGDAGANGFLPSDCSAYHVPTFRVWATPDEIESFFTLTTPASYLSKLYSDPFTASENNGATYSYYKDYNGWILISAGPDEVYDIDPEVEYDSSIQQPSPGLIQKSYDPTNGTVSPGDIFRVKQ
jgi:type II secretory pathway pseudopilin PulG